MDDIMILADRYKELKDKKTAKQEELKTLQKELDSKYCRILFCKT